jgi:polysaccharide export outer membrane protein
MKKIFLLAAAIFLGFKSLWAVEAQHAAVVDTGEGSKYEYCLGVDDVLDIKIMHPDQFFTQCQIISDGTISFPYLGSVLVKGMTLNQVQSVLEKRLSEGYMKYPVVAVSLRESKSRKFFVYGEVEKPGSFPLEYNMTVLKAVSMAGGFTK